jgi:hypothetical protein
VSVVQNYSNPTNPQLSGVVAINATAGFRFSATQPQTNYSPTLQSLLQVVLGGPFSTFKRIGLLPNIVPWRFVDFVSPQLTYAQDLKDSNTEDSSYDVLLRWYFSATDQSPLLDHYGYIIPYGSYPINERRLFSPPKYIKWDSNLPLGNFQINSLYQINGALVGPAGELSEIITQASAITGLTQSSLYGFLMTMQLTEN